MCGKPEDQIIVWALQAIADEVADVRLAKWTLDRLEEMRLQKRQSQEWNEKFMSSLNGTVA